MIVVDSSAFIKFLLREEGWEKVVNYLDPSMNPRTVDYLLVESANAIWKYCKIYEVISDDQANTLLKHMLRLFRERVIVTEEASKYVGDGLNLALEQQIPVYDALFIVQAKTYNATLVTSDQQQAKVAEKVGVNTALIL